MRTLGQIMVAEYQRLEFILNRDGKDAMIAFAKQGYKTYRAQRKMRPMKYGQAYKRELIGSCIVYRRVVRDYETRA